MPAPLLPRPRTAVLTIAVAAAIFVAIGVLVHGSDHGLAVDNRINDWIQRHFDVYTRNDLVATTDPGMTIGLLAMFGFGAALARRWDLLVLTVVAPALTAVLVEAVFKPLFDRTNIVVQRLTGLPSRAYPSGHESPVAVLAVLVAVVTLRSGLRRRAKLGVLVLLAAWFVVTLAGLVGAFYHFATDVVGTLALATAVTLTGALLLDRYWPARLR